MSSTSAVAVVYTFADFLPVVPTGSLVSILLSHTSRKPNRLVPKHGLSTSCLDTGLDSQCADVVFERAVIHHLTHGELIANAVEIHRLLKADGVAYIQDRTQEDVLAADPQYWIRRELLEMYPSLLKFEAKRRPKTEDYCAILKDCGFSNVDVLTFAETRKIYDSVDALAQELRQRKGKSIFVSAYR